MSMHARMDTLGEGRCAARVGVVSGVAGLSGDFDFSRTLDSVSVQFTLLGRGREDARGWNGDAQRYEKCVYRRYRATRPSQWEALLAWSGNSLHRDIAEDRMGISIQGPLR
jgi:hypothetical protein